MKNFAFRQYRRSSKEKEGAVDKLESSEPKNKESVAYQKRREQVRRAQRTHRERKENYTKQLEDEVLQLRSNEVFLNQTNQLLQHEVDRLKQILEQNSIPHSPAITIFASPETMNTDYSMSANSVSIVQNPMGAQQLHVGTGSAGGSLWLTEIEGSPGIKSSGLTQKKTTIFGLKKHSEPEIIGESSNQAPETAHTTAPPSQRIRDMNQTDLGMEFVLTLEALCLDHIQGAVCAEETQAGAPSGHALMASASLLYQAPHKHPVDTSAHCHWNTPQLGLEKLLELSEKIDFDGDIAPVQAWAKLRARRGFENLELGQLRELTRDLLGEMKCHGFGSVIDEYTFENLVEKVLPV